MQVTYVENRTATGVRFPTELNNEARQNSVILVDETSK
jgi:phosphoserine aminotransferase